MLKHKTILESCGILLEYWAETSHRRLNHKGGQHPASDTIWHPLHMGLETSYARVPNRLSRLSDSVVSASPLLACLASSLNVSPSDGLSFSVTITAILPSVLPFIFPCLTARPFLLALWSPAHPLVNYLLYNIRVSHRASFSSCLN